MPDFGDIKEDSTIDIYFTTNDAAGGAVAPSTAFEASDVKIFKNGSATEKTSQNGLTMTSPFNGIVGLHLLSIDTSVNTGDVGFWVADAYYSVVLDPSDETVDGQTVVAIIATYSIGKKAIEIADAYLDRVNGIETGITPRQSERIQLSALAGKSSGHDANAPVYRNPDDTKNRITATTTSDGRTSVTLDSS